MPKLVTDLFNTTSEQPKKTKVVVGRSMVDGPSQSPEERIAQRQKEYEAEMELLERGGYDYGGDGAWAAAMSRVGRR